LCHNAKVVHAFEAGTPFEKLPGTQITYRGKIPIAPAAPPVPHFPRFRALALVGRRPLQRVDSIVMPASENLNIKRHLFASGKIAALMRSVPRDSSGATGAFGLRIGLLFFGGVT
jgi:hypothetical protein